MKADQILQVQWFVVVNDLIGGHCIRTSPKPPSQAADCEVDGWEVGDFLTEEIARHIVALHNRRLREVAG